MSKISGLPPKIVPIVESSPREVKGSTRPTFEALRPRSTQTWDTVGAGVRRFLDLAPEISGFDKVVRALNDAASMFRLDSPKSKEMRQWIVEALKQQEEFIGRKGSV